MLNDLLKNIYTGLKLNYYHYCSKKITESIFDDITQRLGDIFESKIISIDPNPTKFYHNPKAFGLHTDTAKAEIIGMYCLDPGLQPVATEIVYVQDVFDYFTPEELFELKERVMFNDPYLINGTRIPFLSGDKNNYKIYYSDWLYAGENSLGKSKTEKKLLSYIKMKAQNTFGRPLLPGESLFILNKKVLHGRKSITPDSTRCLKRVWINNLNENF